MLQYKIKIWSKNKNFENTYAISHAKRDLLNEVKSGLYEDVKNWRAPMGTGGIPNRSQRKHQARGASLYRNGFHWTWAENY